MYKLAIFAPSIEDGGVEKNLFNITNFLSRNIKDLCLITYDQNKKKKFENNIKIFSIKKKNKKKISRRFKYIACLIILFKFLIKNKKNNPTILTFQANVYCIILSKIFNVKVISRSNASIQGWSKNFITLSIYKIAYSIADEVIVNSKFLKREFKDILNVNAQIIYNPLDKQRILALYKKKFNFTFFKKKTLNLINVGRLTEQKDQKTLIKALNLIKNEINFRLLIIGSGTLKKSLKNLIKKNNLSNQIKIINYTDNPFIYFKKADIFLLSSLFEGLPNVLLEAGYFKKFIISSDCPTGPREILVNGKGGSLFQVSNYKNLSEKILFYSKHKILRKIKSNYLYQSLHRFDYKINNNRYLNLIKRQN
tara:strand:- start:2817 stop:3914 length:1098 start_codon:yes stop_codon:yes gene_type:complete